ncbi:MAG: histidinol dehydrogenase [Woeseiaceae bacterium]|nr:histidinol dehydrogenase [Woeseiaceae bacterium]
MTVNPITWSELSSEAQAALLERPALRDHREVVDAAANIIAAVRRDGDAAMLDFARQFEGADLQSLKVSASEIRAAEAALAADSIAAIDAAIANVRRFHEAQVPAPIDLDTAPGVRCQRIGHPIDAVGLYVPAGSAPLPSTAIMLSVPAAIAGCPTRILCTPPNASGDVDAATLFAAARSGVTDIFKAGGAQAIAAMAYGTESVPRVQRIFGPGNTWVTAAKSLVAGDPAGASIDSPAGPSEVLVVADDSADPRFVAADLLSQAEHGEDSQVILVTDCRQLIERTLSNIEEQLGRLKRREIAQVALRHARMIVTDTLEAAVEVSNHYAPEHLILQTRDSRALLARVRNAGSVFLGRWSPESVGDYCSGTNHVLPTYGAAKSYSGLGVEQFMRHMTVQELTEDGLRSLAPSVYSLAALEGLDAHAAAVRLRLAGPDGVEVR